MKTLVLATAAAASLASSTTTSTPTASLGLAPCDIYQADGAPCVAAHSMARALYASYSGALYAVQRASDGATTDIGALSPGGFADSAQQDAFCAQSTCTVLRVYDQSPQRNHLDVAPGGQHSPYPDHPVDAAKAKIFVGGHPVYGAKFEGGQGYRNDATTGVAVGDAPETIYMVTDGKHYNNRCCFDYGNAEADAMDDGKGTMEAIYWGDYTGPMGYVGDGNGPWVMADLENGLWAGPQTLNPGNPSLNFEFVTAMLKGKPGGWAIKAGDAREGALQTFHEGARPRGYETMKKQGAIVLGVGGDNSNTAIGTFYEGVMTAGYSSDAADQQVQANIVAAGYARAPSPAPTPTPGDVSCGAHREPTCAECPQGHGASWCDGDCQWDGAPGAEEGICVLKGSDVSCGAHRMPTCAECPLGHGASWCNGDCVWQSDACVPRSTVIV